MLSATRLTVALTMKTNTLVFSIGFQYIRQLAKFGRKEGIFYPEPAIFLHFALFLHWASFIQRLLQFFKWLKMSSSKLSFSYIPGTKASISQRGHLLSRACCHFSPLCTSNLKWSKCHVQGFPFLPLHGLWCQFSSVKNCPFLMSFLYLLHIRLPFFCPPVGDCSPWQLLSSLAEPLSTRCAHIDCQKPLSGGEVPKYPSVWHSVTILVGQKSPGLSHR